MRPLDQQVIVITGASSGIGRCAALHLARRGARIVAFARGAPALASLVREIEAFGGRAAAVVGDVASVDDVERLADRALHAFGRIDTWINNASVFIYGRAEDIEPDEYRRVIDVNLLGTIYGSRAAVARMRRQDGGSIIQVSSIVAQRGPAFFSPYAAAKAGVTGFTQALRTELWGSGIRVSTLFLPSVNTPIYQHSRTKFETGPRPAPPVYDPERAAEVLAALAVDPKPEKYIGWFHMLYRGPDRIAPGLGDWFLHRTRGFADGGVAPHSDNLHRPTETLGSAIRGGWDDGGWRGFSLRRFADAVPLETTLAAAVLGFVAAGLSAKT